MSESESKGKTQEQNRRDRIHRLFELIKEGFRDKLEGYILQFPNHDFEIAYKYLYDGNHGLRKWEIFSELEFQTGVRRSRTEDYFKVLVQSGRALQKGGKWLFLGEEYAREIFDQIKVNRQ